MSGNITIGGEDLGTADPWEAITALIAQRNAMTAERDAACEQSAVARERLRNLAAKQPPGLAAAMAETRQLRDWLDDFTHVVIDLDAHGGKLATAARSIRKKAALEVTA